MSQTQEQIKIVLESLVELKKVEKHYNSTLDQLEVAYRKLDKLHDVLEKEYQDFKELEGLSMKSLFHKVLGSKEQQVEKERQEYLQASLQYNDFKKSVELLEYERDLLKKKITDVSILENRLHQLKKVREKELLMSNTEQGKELMRVVHNMDLLISKAKELSEASETGRAASHHLTQLIQFLKNAGEWGQWDMMGRNDRYSAYQKRSAIDQAREASYHAKHHLNRFQKELYDIGERQYNFEVNVGSFNNFSDIFFDNLISDWIVQQKIKNALNNVDGVRDTVTRLLQSVDEKIRLAEQSVKDLIVIRDKIILEN